MTTSTGRSGSADPDHGPPSPTRMAFSWEAVPDSLVRALLTSAAARSDRTRLESAAHDALIAEALQRFGLRNRRDPDTAAARLLRDEWLPDADEASVHRLFGQMRWTVAAASRPSDAAAVDHLNFLQGRKVTEAYARLLWKEFRTAHRRPAPASVRSRAGARVLPGPVVLFGAGTAPRPLWQHQVAAHEMLDERIESGSERGVLLVLPTGSGKTRTAVSWLLKQLEADASTRILWLSHQIELVDQAERAFVAGAADLPAEFSAIMRVVATGRSAPSSILLGDARVVVSTVQSLTAGNSSARRDAVRSFLGPHGFVVVDEAHHAGASSYQDLLTSLRRSRGTWFLGLTATPFPTASGAERRMRKIFGKDDIRPTSAAKLISSGLLARPTLHTVDVDGDITLTSQEARSVAPDLPPSVLRKLQTDRRDDHVIEAWTRDADQWGKTLLYAVSIAHADHLAERLQEAGIAARAIHSRTVDRRAVLAWFRDERGPCVLVSVGILNEGVDLPHARSAFLARPTRSRILLRQMIGRVLRGRAAGGDDVAHIVSFRDDGLSALDVLSPVDLPDIATSDEYVLSAVEASKATPIIDRRTGDAVPGHVLASLRRLLAARSVASDPAVAMRLTGYYDLGPDQDPIPVLEQHARPYADLVRDLVRAVDLVYRPVGYFTSSPTPWPSPYVLGLLREHVRATGEAPAFVAVEVSADPRSVAEELMRGGPKTELERRQLVHERYESSLAVMAYPTVRHFADAVNSALDDLQTRALGEGTPSDPEHVVTAKVRLRTQHVDSLPRLPSLKSVVPAAREILTEDSSIPLVGLEELPTLLWTPRPVTTWWALYDPGIRKPPRLVPPRILVNQVLAARKGLISPEALQYLIFHELLHHVLIGHGHDRLFRQLESQWPGAARVDAELDTLHERLPGSR